ncbi:MAG: alpha/beta fold hydrolase [Saccharofermentans sp.]|nr:alpha/beta fold hydrolase [Saccharofermentans sp.]
MTGLKSKRVQGLFAVLIVFHHLSQMVSASWLPDQYRQPGLEIFVPIGYLLVGFFFFCSGYGLTKSMRTKEYYFDEFFVRRLNRILFAAIFVDIFYVILRVYKDNMTFPLNPYSWYVFTIIILYTGFFLAYRKETKASFAIMCAWVLAYCVLGYVLALGNWWINSCPAFLVGIFMADRKEEKSDGKRLFVSGFLAVWTFIGGEVIKGMLVGAGFKNYGVINSAVVLLQMIASAAFSLFFYYICIKTPGEDAKNKVLVIARKVLTFLGGITLELYLVHGIFVNVFGYHFIDTKPYYYIRNILLYVLVVLALSIPAAFGIKKVFDLMSENYYRMTVLEKIMHDTKRNLIILLCLVVVVTIGLGIKHNMDAGQARAQAEEYKNANVTMLDVSGEQIAVYTAGEGEYTMVLFSSQVIPGSTMNLRPMADLLAEQYRVVIIDLPGSGFSSYNNTTPEVKNYAGIIKGTLDALGVEDNIVLIPQSFAGLYGYEYIAEYPDTLAGVVFIDCVPPEIGPRIADGSYKSSEEYEWGMGRALKSGQFMNNLTVTAGYADFGFAFFDEMFAGTSVKNYGPAMRELVLEGNMNDAYCDEIKYAYANYVTLKEFKLPEDLPVVFLLSSDFRFGDPYGINWTKSYNRIITNAEVQTIEPMSGYLYSVYYEPKYVVKQIEGFMGVGEQ